MKAFATDVISRFLSDEQVATRMQSVGDAHYFAERRVPKGIFQMFEAGSGSNVTMRENRRAFEEVMFRPRAAVFHRERDLRTTVLGHELSMPVIVSSVGFLSIGHPDGEAGVARAAGAAGTIQFLSGVTNTPVEDVIAAASGPVFYQLYYIGGREASGPIIDRAKAAGAAGLVIIADTATTARPRERLYPERASVPAAVTPREAIRFAPQVLAKPRWGLEFLRGARRTGSLEPLMAMGLHPEGTPMKFFEAVGRIYEETPAWEDIPWIRDRWDGPLVIKGILTVEDARRAVDVGADAIVISNHGGNVLDGSVPTLPVLPEIVEAVGDEIEVLMDSGVRRGVDVVKALALGAKAVLLGRAYVYALLAAGEPGVHHMLQLFRQQIDEALAFLGVKSVDELDPTYLELPPSWASARTVRGGEDRPLEAALAPGGRAIGE
ncbi:MAG: alpha-hydroxy-acid oxidizing protein [Actinomycetota bacterium]|nr:alpha-hydroxy-acid oxidizing protein [Actinomycetota bacterium]